MNQNFDRHPGDVNIGDVNITVLGPWIILIPVKILDILWGSAHHLLNGLNAGGTTMISKQHLTSPDTIEASDDIQLAHINSELCWCDPILEFDEDGNQSLTHNEVTWN